ncbi:hypothetical protein Vafri_19421, partial [Volvox africanus]
GVLCIAVLHHLSSRRRRVRLLRQLLRVLRPAGGRALVTVWATEQEDPAKTTAKWTRIPAPDGGGGGGGGRSGVGGDDRGITDVTNAVAAPPLPPASGGADPVEKEEGGSGGCRGGDICSGASGGSSSGGGGGKAGVDYFVPWHLPFHRTEAARAARVAKEAGAQRASGSGDCGGGGGAGNGGKAVAAAAAAAAAGAPKIDAAKGAVVFQRYYHLFAKDELVGLVEEALGAGPADTVGSGEVDLEEVDGGGSGTGAGSNGSGEGGGGSQGVLVSCGVVEDVFYDRSNWCIVFRRDR